MKWTHLFFVMFQWMFWDGIRSPPLCVCVCIRCSSDWRDCEYRERADDKVRWFLDEGERRRVLGAL